MVIKSKNINGLECIIYNIIDYKDNDLLVDVFSLKYGFLTLYVKGAKKTTSKSFYIIRNYNNIKVDVFFKSFDQIITYKSGSIIQSYNYINLDFMKSSILSLFSEVLINVRSNYIHTEFYYKVVRDFISKSQNNSFDLGLILNVFLLRTLNIVGISLTLDKCHSCCATSKIVIYDINNGGFLCSVCKDTYASTNIITQENILNYLYYLDKEDYQRLDLYLQYNKTIFYLLTMYLIDYAGINMTTRKYIY